MCTDHLHLEPDNNENSNASQEPANPEGFKACKYCGCKEYYPVRTGGACQTEVKDRPGGVCGHHYEDHEV